MKKRDKTIVCDKCGNTELRKEVVEEIMRNGWKLRKYKLVAEGWVYSRDLHMDLCPECKVKYIQFLSGFKKEK